MKSARTSSLLAALVLLSACVTINIYFPAAQAQEAAEKIVEDILGTPPAKPPAPAVQDKQSAGPQSGSRSLLQAVLDLLVPPARAAQPDFSVDTPAIRQLQASMKQRNSALQPFYASGAVGFTRNALVEVRDSGAVPLKDRARVAALVAAENQDRNQLYLAVAQANGHPEWEPDVRKVFAGTWVDKAASGWWYQNSSGQWRQK